MKEVLYRVCGYFDGENLDSCVMIQGLFNKTVKI